MEPAICEVKTDNRMDYERCMGLNVTGDTPAPTTAALINFSPDDLAFPEGNLTSSLP